ncbi:VWA domain-containing protein [Myroides sp. C2723]
MKFIFGCILCFLSLNSIYAQVKLKEKRIYLVDLTASMEGKGSVDTPNIFQEVKQSLVNTINNIKSDDTEVTFIPFTNKVHGISNFIIKDKSEIVDYINNLEIKKGDTNIVDAWKAGVAQIDTTKVNYFFMLTDGLHNTGPDKEVLFNDISKWSNFSKNKYFFAFYVMLTEHANEVGIAQAINSSSQIWMIKSMDVNVSFLMSKNFYRMNIIKDNALPLTFDISNKKFKNIVGLNIVAEGEIESYYRIIKVENHLNEGEKIKVFFEEKVERKNIPLSVSGSLHINYNKELNPLLFFTPDMINIQIDNVGIRSMYFKAK